MPLDQMTMVFAQMVLIATLQRYSPLRLGHWNELAIDHSGANEANVHFQSPWFRWQSHLVKWS